MKIAMILGSPRVDSVSAKIAEKAVEALPGDDKEIKKYVLNQITAKGCQACYSCKGKTETCVIKDELAQALSACQEADWIVATTPVYIGDISAQLKLFVDRTFAWYAPGFLNSPKPSRIAPGKKMILVVTQGNPSEDAYRKEVEKMLNYFGSHGIDIKAYVAVIPYEPKALEDNMPTYFEEAKRLVSSF
jgi:multimeric flavodoxin WrbA